MQPPAPAPLDPLSAPLASLSPEPATDGPHSWSPARPEPLSAPVQSPVQSPDSWTSPTASGGTGPLPAPLQPPGTEPWPPEPWTPEPEPAPQPGSASDFGRASVPGSAQQSWFAQAAKPADPAQSNGAARHGAPPTQQSFDAGQPGGASYNGHGTPAAPHDPRSVQEPTQQSFDPESTAAWSLSEETPSGPYARPPEPTAEPTARDAWSMPEEEPRGGESIVPDSWFAGPRAADPREADAQGPAMWTPPPTDSEATMQVPWAAQSPAPPAGPHQFGPPPGPQQFGPPGPQQLAGPGQGTQQFGPPQGGPQQFGSAPAGTGWGPEPQHDWAGGQGRNETALLQGPGGGLPPAYPGSHLGPGQGPGMPDGNQPKRSEASRSLIIAVTVLVIAALAAVALVMWPDGGSKTSGASSPAAAKKTTKGTSAGAHQQAVAVNAILNASGTSRGELGRALTAARKCDGLGTAIAGMQTVAQQRQTQISQTRALKVDGLANGARIRSTLGRAINYSLEVDKAYLAWAQASQNGCKGKPKPTADSKRGARLSAQASAAKQQFAALWAPVAQKEGMPHRGPTSF
ncbi:MAG: hypothetical protein QOE54_3316 [Streptosporangiaceae bacterium]|nr:hypothetical protein [Streptosporangiaceae bacterium]